MSKYIKEFNKSIPNLLCEEIIEKFEKEKTFPGTTMGGINKNILDSSDFIIDSYKTNWKKCFDYLSKELSKKLELYLNINKYHPIDKSKIFTRNFIIKKYEKNKGKYIFHNDELFFEDTRTYRFLTFVWYLNSIEEGGETVFEENNIEIKPEVGKLLLFPSNWTFTHRSAIPITDNKYAIVGWIECPVIYHKKP